MLAPSLGAQADTARALRLLIAAGPAFGIGDMPRSADDRFGYAVQGSVQIGRLRSPWRFRGDAIWQHLSSGGQQMGWRADGSYAIAADAVTSASVAALANAILAQPRTAGVAAYLIGGMGIAWPDAMTMTNGWEETQNVTRFAWQAGVGLEWRFGGRALGLEARVLSVGAASRISSRTMPVTIGVTF